MAAYETQACPLCGTEAEYCRVDAGNRKYFQCPKCSYFQISKRAEKVLSESSSQRRKHYSQLSPKAPDDQLFVVIMPTAEFRGNVGRYFAGGVLFKVRATFGLQLNSNKRVYPTHES